MAKLHDGAKSARCARADAALVGYVSGAKQAKQRGVRGLMPHWSATCPARSRPNRAACARADAALVGYVSGAKQAKSMRCVRGPAGRICGAQEVRAVIMA